MYKPITFILILFLFSCSSENTDTTVEENENPTKVEVEIDTLPPPLDTIMFNNLAFQCFFHLGKATDGEFYYKIGSELINDKIVEVLQDHACAGSDIIFLIDKTGSMANDISNVKKNLNQIIDQLSKWENIHIGVSVYGDKNVDGSKWWSSTDLTSDFGSIRSYVNSIKVSDGGDYPESVYDGIAQVVNSSSWRKESNKMILVIGDAPSLEDSLSDYSRNDIVNLCTSQNIKANIFPVLVTPWTTESFLEYNKFTPKFVEKIYPNPAKDVLNIKMQFESDYLITLLDLNGLVVLQEETKLAEVTLNIPTDVKNGTYILRVFNTKAKEINAEKIVIQR